MPEFDGLVKTLSILKKKVRAKASALPQPLDIERREVIEERLVGQNHHSHDLV